MHPAQSKRWRVLPPAPPDFLRRFADFHPLLAQVLYNRGLTDPRQARRFLTGGEPGASPFFLADMDRAVARLRRAIRAGEPIAIYGDFDVDGVTATALLVETLQALGAQVIPYIPHRVTEGYGLNPYALDELAERGVRVVVTVDCGIRSLKEVAHGRARGLEIIVTDHHSIGPDLPPALAVINPKRPDNRYPFRDLAGVGVAYKLAQALLMVNRHNDRQRAELDPVELTDLVALGTVADLMPLRGENRYLVRQGLRQINARERPGLEALIRRAGYAEKEVNATAIGYVLGPRINAAGRLDHARKALQLLIARYPGEVEHLADELNDLNRRRQQITQETYEIAREQALAEDPQAPLIFAASERFLEGVVGLAAGRLVEEFYRPSVVVRIGERESRGSARSIPEFHITRALDACVGLLEQHGGHAAAAGFTVRSENLPALAQPLKDLAAEALSDRDLQPTLEIDAEVPLSALTPALYEDLARLEPCGEENPPPLFLSRNVQVVRARTVGSADAHLKLSLTDGRVVWDAIAFRQGAWLGELPSRLDVVYHLEVNEWNGVRYLQLNVQDLRPGGK